MRLLTDAGIRHFDAAFPESSPEEKEFVRLARTEVPDAVIGCSCRLIRDSVELAMGLGAHELFVIVPVSDIHLEKRLKITRPELLASMQSVLEGIPGERLVNLALEDVFRADEVFQQEVLQCACELGVQRVFLADTVGNQLPWQVRRFVARIREDLPREIDIGTHFHNDFGLALANSLAAVEAGASFPTAAVNGLGERAGNTDIALLAAAARFLMDRPTTANLAQLQEASELVARRTGILVAQNAPITGFNAFRHTSGTHVHGYLSDKTTYEAFDPAAAGGIPKLVLGKHSGRAHIRHLVADRKLAAGQIDDILARVKARALHRSGTGDSERLHDEFVRFNEQLGISEEEVARLMDEEEGK